LPSSRRSELPRLFGIPKFAKFKKEMIMKTALTTLLGEVADE